MQRLFIQQIILFLLWLVIETVFGKYVTFQKLRKIEEETSSQIGFGEIEMLAGRKDLYLYAVLYYLK